jgi:hypothetical protein
VAQTGDAVALFQTLMSATWYGVVGDGNTPGGLAATLEMVDDEAVITTDVLVGPKGEPGRAAPLVELQWPALEQPADLDALRPTLTQADAGKAWWCGTVVGVWDGLTFHLVRPGPAGPPGSTPQISFSAETIPLADRVPGMKDEVVQSGTSLNPHLHFKLLSPQGPRGPSTNITSAPDYDSAGGAPDDGQTLVWNKAKQKWTPSDFAAKQPQLYSIPEQAFTNFTGLAQRHTILSYTIPAQDYSWVPYVSGHIKAYGAEIFDSDPLQIGVEVRLGDAATGQLIGRGFGDLGNWSHLKPHFSEAGDTATAVAPDNGIAQVKKGVAAKISISLCNDGLIGAYIYNRAGSQVTILTVPQGD